MAINFTNALSIHAAALRLRSQRTGVLANNLANVDTPNFKARDIDFQRLLNKKMGSQSAHSDTAARIDMVTTHEKHRTYHDSGILPVADQLRYRTPNQPSIDGNTVEEQVEHAEYTKNMLAFQASFHFLDSAFKGLKTAIRGEL